MKVIFVKHDGKFDEQLLSVILANWRKFGASSKALYLMKLSTMP